MCTYGEDMMMLFFIDPVPYMVEVNESQKALVGQLVIMSLEKDLVPWKIERSHNNNKEITYRQSHFGRCLFSTRIRV